MKIPVFSVGFPSDLAQFAAWMCPTAPCRGAEDEDRPPFPTDETPSSLLSLWIWSFWDGENLGIPMEIPWISMDFWDGKIDGNPWKSPIF